MDTLSWLEIMLFALVLVGTGFYYLGHAMGKEQAKKDVEALQSSMRNHPTNHLRVMKDPQ